MNPCARPVRRRRMPVLQVILPIGISFYTFEAINYTVDVYRGRVRAERNLGQFHAVHPVLPAPGGRADRSGPRFPAADQPPQAWDWDRLHLGTQFFLLGLFKKLAIADRMAVVCRSGLSPTRQTFRSSAVLLGVIAYAMQIYCDFSGYTDMAIGTAHMLGYKLAQNFNMPYLAVNVSEFWRRWHISLSSWLRDYLFIPLGGSRGSRWQTCWQPADHHDAGRPVARRQLDLRVLGRAARSPFNCSSCIQGTLRRSRRN